MKRGLIENEMSLSSMKFSTPPRKSRGSVKHLFLILMGLLNCESKDEEME